MKIDILSASQFMNFKVDMPRGIHNSGGGMAVLLNGILSTLKARYDINTYDKVEDLSAPLCIVEPCFFCANSGRVGEDRKSIDEHLDAFAKARAKLGFKSVLFTAEKSLLRIRNAHRATLLSMMDGLYVTCPYITNFLKTIGIYPDGLLCDCISADLFRPAPKDLSVIAVGALKHIKNIDWIIEVFHLLKGKIKTIYLGGAGLWSSEQRPEDMILVSQIQQAADVHISNAASVEVAYHCNHASFAVNDTWHDCSSRSNEELLMSGVISVHGNHPLFVGRPGFKVNTPQEAADIIGELTNNFTELPDPALNQASRDWALKHASEDCFINQFGRMLRRFV